MNRRGSAADVILIAAMLFGLGLGFFVLHYVMAQVVAQLVANPEVASSPAAVAGFQASNMVAGRLDYFMLAIMIGLTLSVVVSSWFIQAHPIFLIFYFLVLVIGVIVSMGLSNAWDTFSTNPTLTTSLAAFPITNNILSYLPQYVAAMGFLAMVVLFAKPSNLSGYFGGGHL